MFRVIRRRLVLRIATHLAKGEMERRVPPPSQSAADFPDLTIKLEERKRRLYKLALIVALPSIVFAWYFYRDTNLFIRYGYPWLIAAALIWVIALFWKRIPLKWIEHFMLFTTSLFFLVKYFYLLFLTDLTTQWQELEATYWVTALLFLLAYIIANHHLTLRFALGYSGVTFVGGLWRLYPGEMERLIEMIRLNTRVVILALLAFILAKIKDDLLESQSAKSYWEWQANIDHLTQLPNRRMLSNLIESWIASRTSFAVLLIDLDNFKCFNDTYGHDVGDVLLSRLAFTLRSNLRASDFAARWGGEEFLVLVGKSTTEQAVQLAERLRTEVENMSFGEDRVSISIGGTLFKQSDDLNSLIKRADTALYSAKQQGRNRVCWG
ncbi:MAG: hypothetical protein DDG59_03710 [Anaerolineae bacterium]|nr:MAG: hypothetical protein DDG59_03710 [Anaerolineae bacterium]